MPRLTGWHPISDATEWWPDTAGGSWAPTTTPAYPLERSPLHGLAQAKRHEVAIVVQARPV
jgi:hypothetical protein